MCAALAGFARIRTLRPDGRLCTGFSGHPDEAPKECRPWFRIPERRSRGVTVVFGHWAALGLHLRGGIAGLDAGCSWGRELSALRLDDGAVFQQPNVELESGP